MSKQQKTEWDERIEEAFSIFDRDRDGKISVDELRYLVREIGYNPTENELRDLMKYADKNKSGVIEINEFKRLLQEQDKKLMKSNNRDVLKRAFQVFDRDGNGKIDAKELQAAMKTLGDTLTDEECNLMIKVADTNSDGKIDYMEFIDFISSNSRK
ncbi:hypothetical protein ACJMK2_004455 [Sinanodonta woodiana]|uniref:Sulfhydryl light chain n=1 Tax=Sinanodonta woodiana TaxID=1069815 RepID=A0ABD3Y2H6_SINWO